MKRNYWDMDSFGSYLPANWEEICEAANAIIDEYFDAHPEIDDSDRDYYDDLWENYCNGMEPRIPDAVEAE